MFRRPICFVFIAILFFTTQLTTAFSADDDVTVSQVVGEKAKPQEFQATPMNLGPRPADPTAEFTPLPLLLKEDGGHSDRPREMVTFDLRTRTARYASGVKSLHTATRRTPSGAGGAIVDPTPSDFDKDFGALYLISDPTIDEYPRQVRISMTFVNTMGQMINASCSATMIDAKHVLTAAHCVYMEKDKDGVPVNDWATSVRVDPGYNYGPSEMGSSFAVQLHTWTGWTQDFDYDYDAAVIDLDRPIGALSGWRGLGTTSDFSWFETGVWRRYSYPGSDHYDVPVYDGQQMYGHTGTFDHDEDEQIGFDRDMYRGTSGGGAIRDNIVWAVRSHARLGNPQTSWDTRVTNGMFGDIVTWLDADRPASVDLFAMDVQASELGAASGFPIEGLSFLVHNYSTASFNGTVNYTVVLSDDANVSTADHYVTSGTAGVNLGAQGSARIYVPAASTFVPAIATGDYTLGVIITNSDANPSNNSTQGDDALLFGVLCAAQAAPVLANPDPFHPCVPTDVTLAWGGVSGIGVSYEMKIGTSLDSGMTVYATNSTQYLVTGLAELTRYFWRVRAISACGAVGTWSAPWQFTTKGTMVEIPKIYPGPEEFCVDTTVDFTWDEIPGAASYRVRINDTSGGPTQFVDAVGNTAQQVGLTPGVRYYWTIKPKDACGLFGSYGSRNFFTVKSVTPVTAVLETPAPGTCTGADALFQTQFDGSSTQTEFEIQNAAGDPSSQSTVTGNQLWVLDMAENDYRWRARASSCTTGGEAWGAWSEWQYFSVDRTAPAFAGPPTSPSHVPGVWSGFSLVNVSWPLASDNCGVAAYWYSWDQSPDSVPDGSTSVSGSSDNLEGEVSDGADNWFHLVAVDSAGNLSTPQHLGPFFVDLTPPSIPVLSSSLPSGSWQNVDDLTVDWEPAVDATSGVSGYSVAWSNSASYVVDETVDTTALTATASSVAEGFHYFYVKSVDAFGNASAQVQYNLNVDRGAPWIPPFGLSGSYNNGDLLLLQYNFNDNYTAPYNMRLEHEYTPDNGVTWYAAEICGANPNLPCSQDGTWPVGSSGNALQQKYWRIPWVNTAGQINLRVTAIDLAGNRYSGTSMNGIQIFITTSVENDTPVATYELNGNAPNPFNPSTTIRYAVPRSSRVSVMIYDVTGRRIRTLVDEVKTGPARYETVWDGRNDGGQTMASGMYVYRLQAGDFSEAKRMTLLK